MTHESTGSADPKPRVGFIGLGDIGAPMAINIAKAGFELTVFDLRESAMVELAGHGARPAASVAELASQVDVLCTCVLYDHQVRDIFLGDDGILANARPGCVALVHSTIFPNTVEELARLGEGRGIEVVDAPISGASTRSREGTLSMMVGGSEEALKTARPVLQTVAAHIFPVGVPGHAQIAKLGNNIMALCNQVVAMEAVRFAEAFGLDRERLFEIARVSSGASWAVDTYEHFDRYGIEHTLAGSDELPHELGKDLRTVVSIAQEDKTYLPLVALCSHLLPIMFAQRWAALASAQAGAGSDEL